MEPILTWNILTYTLHKQSPRGVLTERHLCQSLLFDKVAGWRLHRCFSVNFVKFLRTSFLTEHLCWLLLTLKGRPLYNSNIFSETITSKRVVIWAWEGHLRRSSLSENIVVFLISTSFSTEWILSLWVTVLQNQKWERWS